MGIQCSRSLTDDVSFRRFFVTGADGLKRLIDLVLVALRPHAHRPVRVVASIASEVVHDRLLLDHCPEADLLNPFAYYRGRNRFLLRVCRDRSRHVLGRKIGVRPQRRTDWIEVPNLWGCIVGRPGAMKSPAMGEALKPLNQLDAKAREGHSEALKGHASKIELHKLKQAAARRALKGRHRSAPPRYRRTRGAESAPLRRQ